MKEDFDHLVRSYIEEIDDVPGITVAKEVVWNKISKTIHNKGRNGPSSSWITIAIICLTILSCYFMYHQNKENEVNIKRAYLEKVDVTKKGVVLSMDIQITALAIPKNVAMIPKKKSKGYLPKEKIASVAVDSLVFLKHDYLFPEKEVFKADYGAVFGKSASVHIYRPGRYVGSALAFKLKANGMVIDKVKNGKYTIVQIRPGKTYFTLGKQKLFINVKSGENYYLRVSYNGFPFGKQGLDWMTKTIALDELSQMGILNNMN